MLSWHGCGPRWAGCGGQSPPWTPSMTRMHPRSRPCRRSCSRSQPKASEWQAAALRPWPWQGHSTNEHRPTTIMTTHTCVRVLSQGSGAQCSTGLRRTLSRQPAGGGAQAAGTSRCQVSTRGTAGGRPCRSSRWGCAHEGWEGCDDQGCAGVRGAIQHQGNPIPSSFLNATHA